jgi:hypothetical protein
MPAVAGAGDRAMLSPKVRVAQTNRFIAITQAATAE